ncbi:MAG: hypothetical protein IPF99_20925 [Deltaproteobacteria bacterium]|nr:hypothetical protein [Deltaproteobacteria bacterium]
MVAPPSWRPTEALAGRISHSLAGPRRRPGDRRRPRRRRPGQPATTCSPRPRGRSCQRSAGDTLQTPGNGFCDLLPDFALIDESARSGAAPFVLAEDPARQRGFAPRRPDRLRHRQHPWSLDLRSLTWTSSAAPSTASPAAALRTRDCRSLCQ